MKHILNICLIFLIISCKSEPVFEIPQHDWSYGDGYKWTELTVPKTGKEGFYQLPASRTGITFRNELTEDEIVYNRNLLNGSGVAVGDVTGNGYPDIYFARMSGPNVLYQNNGSWNFTDITENSGLSLPDQYSSGAAFADLNGNGFLDVIVSSYGGGNRILINDGSGLFTEKENALHAPFNAGSTSIAVGDLTGNGAPDIYISNYKYRSVRDMYAYENEFSNIVREVVRDDRTTDYEVTELFEGHYHLEIRDGVLLGFETGEGDFLYLNDGDGNFTHVEWDAGVFNHSDGTPYSEAPKDWGLHVKIMDITDNGLPDIYVSNDFESPDRIWLNQGDGTFLEADHIMFRKLSLSAMAADKTDIIRNGHTDIFVVEMLSQKHELRQRQMSAMAPSPVPIGVYDNKPRYMGNSLYMNRGDNTFAEIAEYAGVRRSDWSWGVLFQDINLNGYEDAVITTGHYYDVQDADVFRSINERVASGRLDKNREMLEYPPLKTNNVIFKNNGDLTFTDVSTQWGLSEQDVAHGLAFADLDGDGLPDLIINRLSDEAAIFRNITDKPRIAIRLRGSSPNTQATGAIIRFSDGQMIQTKEVITGGSYVSGSDQLYAFAATGNTNNYSVEIQWRDGKISEINGLKKNRKYVFFEDELEKKNPDSITETITPLFSDHSDALNHIHHETPFDDFERQALLPWKLSLEGPGVAVYDVTGNGYQDIVIGSGRGGYLTLLENQDGQNFNHTKLMKAPDDITGVSVVELPDYGTVILAAISGYERGTHQPAVIALNPQGEKLFEIRGWSSVRGALAVADYNGDGFPGLFVAGRSVVGKYPGDAESRLFLYQNGRFVPDEQNNQLLKNAGLVTGAVFSDLQGNGWPDLLLSTEWGTIKAFENNSGIFTDKTSQWGFSELHGLWKGIATADLTNDGQMEIIAANMGLNSQYSGKNSGTQYVYYGDIFNRGYYDIIEAYHEEQRGRIVPRRTYRTFSEEMPFIRNQVRSNKAFAENTYEENFSSVTQYLNRKHADTFEHTVFRFDGRKYQPEALPDVAQFSPAWHIAVADIDGDGNQDVMLTQNFFQFHEETPRNDAGRSLLLKGDGHGNLKPVDGKYSGLKVYGEQRGGAVADFNNNGKTDALITQNGNQTRLFYNDGASTSFRVIVDTDENYRSYAGASARMHYANGEISPRKEFQFGSGYLSQNSPVLLFAMHQQPIQLEIIMLGGQKRFLEISEGQTELHTLTSEFAARN